MKKKSFEKGATIIQELIVSSFFYFNQTAPFFSSYNSSKMNGALVDNISRHRQNNTQSYTLE